MREIASNWDEKEVVKDDFKKLKDGLNSKLALMKNKTEIISWRVIPKEQRYGGTVI